MPYNVAMIGLGCAKNQVDGEMLLSTLEQAGFHLVPTIEEADVVLINTCGFIESAKKEAIETIFSVIEAKEAGIISAVVVTGCLAERYREEILKEMPEVDAVVGIGANDSIASVVQRVLQEQRKVEAFGEKQDLPLSGSRVLSTPKHYAYLKVADGCDNCCTYCAIPLIRGHFRSRPMEDVVAEAKTLAQNGVKELMVIAQDTTRYGEDLYGKLMLPALLKELCKIEGIHWIRLLYCYPDRVTDELLTVMAEEEKVLPYMDLPLQHCSEPVLKAMNRRGSVESLTALLTHMREMVPNLILRTTFLVGFPGETEADFDTLCTFAKDIRFDRLGCFPYSKEEDTPAYHMANQIPEDVKQHRAELLMEQQMDTMAQLAKEQVGKQLEVLCEGYDETQGWYYGRSIADAPDVDGAVYFRSANPVQPGDFIFVTMTDAVDCDLYGEVEETR